MDGYSIYSKNYYCLYNEINKQKYVKMIILKQNYDNIVLENSVSTI